MMINNLRETLASQTSIGVVGLINFGKSKLVCSMFEVMVSTVVEVNIYPFYLVCSTIYVCDWVIEK